MEDGEISCIIYVYFDFASVLPVHLSQLSVVNILNKNKCVNSETILNENHEYQIDYHCYHDGSRWFTEDPTEISAR